MDNGRKAGLAIIDGLISALNEVATVADTLAKEKGGESAWMSDHCLKAARIKLGEALTPAIVPDREKWLSVVNQRVGIHGGWLQEKVGYLVEAEKYKSMCDWTAPKIRDDSLEAIKRLKRFEPSVRKEADEAFKKTLSLLD